MNIRMKLFVASVFTTMILFTMPCKSFSEDHEQEKKNPKVLFSFGIIADVQYTDSDSEGNKSYRSSLTKLKEAITTLKNDSVDFILNLGDIIDRDFNSYKPVMNILNSSGIKIYNAAGNHDYSVESRYKKKLPVLALSKTGYYSFEYKNFKFIVLNGNEISIYSSANKASVKKAESIISEMKEKGEVNAIDWNGGISSNQIAWLSEQLNSATNKGEKVFLICHFPVFPENIHNLLNYKEVLPVLEKYNNIIAWFNGHNHSGNYGNFNMIHFVTFKGMVETEAINSFARVEVFKNKIWITGYGREKSQILAY